MGGLVTSEYSRTTVGSGNKTELPQLEVPDCVGREASHVGLPRIALVGSRVMGTANTTVSTAINEREARP